MDLWTSSRREQRPEWQHYLKQAEHLVTTPRKPLPKDIVNAVLNGDINIDTKCIQSMKKKIMVFVSSTFTDTKAERNILMKDVYPYLRALCRILGMDFDPVDMRWGVNEDTTLSHATATVCINEVHRCIRESGGPSFLCILGHKYGYRPFPAEIKSVEFEKLREQLVADGENTSLMDEYFKQDLNMIPPHHVLKPRQADDKNWWDVFEQLKKQLRQASKCLLSEEREKYFVSVTEQEVEHGMFLNEDRQSQAILMRRTLADIRHSNHRHRHIIDVVSGEIDEDAQEHLHKLREEKVIEHLGRDAMIDFEYSSNEESMVKEYVRVSCDAICKRLCDSILHNYQEKLHVDEDEVFSEIIQHKAIAEEKSNLFVGREDIVRTVQSYVNGESNKIFVIHGRSGCGKTALMAKCSANAKAGKTSAVMILRFLGTTATSGSARAMLQSVCLQITRAYGKNPAAVPNGYKELVPYFQKCLDYASSQKPLILFLDSLDQLSNEDFGKNLKWLPMKKDLPAHVNIVVSTLPGECLDILQVFIPEKLRMEVEYLDVQDGAPILDKMLAAENRTLTSAQRRIVIEAFKKCPLPLYLRLAADVALKWHSYDEISPDELPSDMPGLILTLFKRIESKYGKTFVNHALAYITVAKNGLTGAELEDILSCDNEALDEIFSFWVPPFIRVPPLLWIRIRNELGMYLVERGSDGVNTYSWYHRQFWETAEELFVKQSPAGEEPFETKARQAIAEYFEGKWYDGKEFTRISKGAVVSSKVEKRHIASQPLVVTGDRTIGRKLNKRKLRELSYQLLKLKDWNTFQRLILDLDFIECKFTAEQGYDLVAQCLEASKPSDNKAISAMSDFIGKNLSHLLREPDSIFQLASQQVPSNHIRILFEEYSQQNLPRGIVRDQNPSEIEDPRKMTLRGHTSGVRSCSYSPNGDLIASCAEDGSVRVWDPFSGAEIMSVTGLPGPTYPGLADPYHGERPCCFSRDGKIVATGSEDGWLQLWDMAGAEVFSNNVHTDCITMVAYSPDGRTLATSSKDGTAKFWNCTERTITSAGSVSLGMKALGCDYSPDGSILAVSTYGGLVTVDTKNLSVRTTGQGHTNQNLCACYSPDGKHIVTAGDNSSISLWDAGSGSTIRKLTGHKGWIWCCKYNKDGTKLLSCSSDRLLKLWNMTNYTCMTTVGGHLHRVSCVSIKPNTEDTFVTGSLDFSLSVWDFQAVIEGKVPPVGSLHYVLLRTSPDGQYCITLQGWGEALDISKTDLLGHNIARTQTQNFMEQAAFSVDSKFVVSVDTGHGGQYTKGAVYKATVYVSAIPSGNFIKKLDVRAPCVAACSKDYIYIGTAECKVNAFRVEDYSLAGSWDFQTDGGSRISVTDAYGDYIKALACRSEGDHIAVVAGELVKVWHFSTVNSTVTMVAELPSKETEKKTCIYSPNGAYLVTSDYTGQTEVWDAKNNYHLLKTLVGHISMTRDLDFSPSGRYLATVAVEMSLRVWDFEDDFKMKHAWYSPINQLGFVKENVLVLGEATGLQRCIEF